MKLCFLFRFETGETFPLASLQVVFPDERGTTGMSGRTWEFVGEDPVGTTAIDVASLAGLVWSVFPSSA